MFLFLAACAPPEPTGCEPKPPDVFAGHERNVLVLVSDDIGIDNTGVYGHRETPSYTPTIDALADNGIRFTNAYATPSCSPTRASLLTGRYPSRTGIGRWIYAETDLVSLADEEVTIPEMLRASPYRYTSSAVGKWHLVSFTDESPATHPLDQGFQCHAGSLANPMEAVQEGNTPRGYDNWERADNGVVDWETTYMTIDTTDEALDRLATLASPWFAYVAYNAAHDPLHAPPNSLISAEVPEDATQKELYDAMVESADTEIARLLAGVPAETTIIYLSDNGTPDHGREPGAQGGGKGTVYENGVNVPFIVTGPLVEHPGTTSDALVHVVDILPTIAEIAGVTEVRDGFGIPVELDGHSFLPLLADPEADMPRDHLFSEGFWPNGEAPHDWHDRTVRDEEWKLVRKEAGETVTEELYRLDPDAWSEGEDLLAAGPDAEAQDALDRLRGIMEGYLP